MNHITAFTAANSNNREMRKQFDASISSARHEVRTISAQISSDILNLTKANLDLVNVLSQRKIDLQQVQGMQVELLDVAPQQDKAIQDLTAEVQNLQSALQKSQVQYQQLKNLLDQTNQAAAGSATAITALKQDVLQAQVREAATQRRFEELKGEFVGLHQAMKSSDNERVQTLQELKAQNIMLSQFLSQFEFLNEMTEKELL
jgi:chromosome segregation ATPase